MKVFVPVLLAFILAAAFFGFFYYSHLERGVCRAAGPFPDHVCTPGAVFPVGAREICKKGYSASVRNVSVDLKSEVYRKYGLAYPQAPGAYEVDHFIPLELGGSNDIMNLFPEAAYPAPGFHEKDLVENYLHDEVCSGRMALALAQEKIRANWLEVYQSLTPEQIESLKHEFSSY